MRIASAWLMRRQLCMLCLFAAVSCSDKTSTRHDPPVAGESSRAGGGGGSGKAGTRGEAGNSAGVGGTRPPQWGDECVPERDNDAGSSECTGGVIDFLMQCHARYETVQCYVQEAASGELDCPPASDPQLPGRLSDSLVQYGFVPQAVIREDKHRLLPGSCEAQLSCCAATPVEWRRQVCYDVIDGANAEYIDTLCAGFGSDQRQSYGCPNPSDGPSDTDASAEPESRHGLCCYLACGYTHLS